MWNGADAYGIGVERLGYVLVFIYFAFLHISHYHSILFLINLCRKPIMNAIMTNAFREKNKTK